MTHQLAHTGPPLSCTRITATRWQEDLDEQEAREAVALFKTHPAAIKHAAKVKHAAEAKQAKADAVAASAAAKAKAKAEKDAASAEKDAARAAKVAALEAAKAEREAAQAAKVAEMERVMKAQWEAAQAARAAAMEKARSAQMEAAMGSTPAPASFTVAVPPGWIRGTPLKVQIAGHGLVSLNLPITAAHGSTFTFSLNARPAPPLPPQWMAPRPTPPPTALTAPIAGAPVVPAPPAPPAPPVPPAQPNPHHVRFNDAVRAFNELMRLKSQRDLAEQPLQTPADATCEFPSPPGRLFVDDASSSQPLVAADGTDVMCAWAFFGRFGSYLQLEPFAPEALCAALQRPGESLLLADIHVRLLRALLQQNVPSLRAGQRTPPPGTELMLQQVPTAESVSPASWPEVLRAVVHLAPEVEPPADALAALQAGEYTALRPRHKLSLVMALIDAWLSCGTAQQLLQEAVVRIERQELECGRQRYEREMRWQRLEREAAQEHQPDAGMVVRNPHHEAAGKAATDGGAGTSGAGTSGAGTSGVAAGEGEGGHPPLGLPTEESSLALLDALRSGSEAELERAIASATASHSGTEAPGGRQWWTHELCAATHALGMLKRHAKLVVRRAAAAEERAEDLHLEDTATAACALKETPLGVDRSGRRYWSFPRDGARLWVERTDATAAGDWSWGFYVTPKQVVKLLAYMDASGAEPSLRRALRERLPTWSKRWAEAAGEDEEQWVCAGHESLGQPVIRSFKTGGVIGRVSAWLPPGAADDDEELFKVMEDTRGTETSPERGPCAATPRQCHPSIPPAP